RLGQLAGDVRYYNDSGTCRVYHLPTSFRERHGNIRHEIMDCLVESEEYTMEVSKTLIHLQQGAGDIELVTNAARYRIVLLSDDIIRVRCTFEEQFQEESSYALAMTAWEDKMDGVIPDRIRVAPLPINVVESDEHVKL